MISLEEMDLCGRAWEFAVGAGFRKNLVPDDLATQFARILTSTIRPQLQEVLA